VYAVCVYRPFHLAKRIGLVIAVIVFLAAFLSGVLKRQ